MRRPNPWLQFAAGRAAPAGVEPVQIVDDAAHGEHGPQVAIPVKEEISAAVATGPTSPQPFVAPPVVGLPIRTVADSPMLWWVGTHGGAGESTMAALDSQWQATGHCWPAPAMPGAVAPCVLVARTHAEGLMALQRALQQWAASAAGSVVQLVGVVLLADAPGRLPAPLRDLVKVIGGGAPRVWEVPWVEAWRFGNPREHVPRTVMRIIKQINMTVSEQQALS